MNEKGISSNLWIIDDPFVKGHLLGYIQDHTYEIDYPVVYDGDTLRICDSSNRVEVATEIELPGNPLEMISTFLYEGSFQHETDMDRVNSDVSLSGEISIFKTEAHIVSNEPEEFGCFHAVLLDMDGKMNIQCMIQTRGDIKAYNRIELTNDFNVDITKLIQICDSGNPENPLIVGLNEDENTLISYNTDGSVAHTMSFQSSIVFSTIMSPGIRLIGYTEGRILFLDICDHGFEEVGTIELEAEEGFFFDSIKSHATDSPLISFYDGKIINYIDPHNMTIQATISATNAKPGLDSTCFPTDNGVLFVENTIVSPVEILTRSIRISDEPMTPILRYQMGSYDGGLYGFTQKDGMNSVIKIYHVYPNGQPHIKEYLLSDIEEDILSIDFCGKTKKLYLFAKDVYFETEHLNKWIAMNTIELDGFEQ